MKKLLNVIIYFFAALGFTLTVGFFAVKFGLTNEKGIIDAQRNSFIQKQSIKKNITKQEVQEWQNTEEWQALSAAILKDKDSIYKAAEVYAINPRIIVAIIVVEQLRLYSDSRELFKTVFAPLKILGVQSQFSWGVVGIKRETAIAIEEHLKDTNSPFYLGKGYENTLDFSTNDHEKERFTRLTDQHNRYYSYLYTAALIKQLERQWDAAGYSIVKQPDIVATLFNIGFTRSSPKANPSSGGASITIAGKTYSFGSLAGDFYASHELEAAFPQ